MSIVAVANERDCAWPFAMAARTLDKAEPADPPVATKGFTRDKIHISLNEGLSLQEPVTDARKPDPLLRLHDTVRLSATGLAKVLGDLEARVMRVMWEIGRAAPARHVHERIAREHAVAVHTVITVLNKLVEKGLLRREKREDLLHYEPTLGEEEFRAQASRQVVEGILSFGPNAVTASFVDVLAERDPGQLAELARLIEQRLKERQD